MGPHEVAGGLCNNVGGFLRRHAPEHSAREPDMAGALRAGSGGGIGLGRQYKQGKEVQSPKEQLVGVPCGCTRPNARQNAGIFIATGHIAG